MRIYEIEELIKKYGEYMSLGEVLRNLKGNHQYKCPKCKGKGEIYEHYQKDLGGWNYEDRVKTLKCDLCKGVGYTEKEYKPVTKTEIIGYKE